MADLAARLERQGPDFDDLAWAEGYAKTLDSARASAVQLARDRFGDLVAAQTEARLAGVTRVDSLLEAYRWAGSCDSESALLARLAAI